MTEEITDLPLDHDFFQGATIFVQMAAYKDPELIPTLLNMLENCANPETIRVVVCWQHGSEQKLSHFTDAGFTKAGKCHPVNEFRVIRLEKDGATIDLIDVPYQKTKGACWARNLIQQYYDGEKYTLQLDSHHRFVSGWNTLLVKWVERLRAMGHKKPLLTAYVPSYDPDNEPNGRVQSPWQMNFDRFIPEGAVFFMPAEIPNYARYRNPIPARFFSAHFAFADGSFAVEVQHDPEYFFHGEEISIAVRAFTHGYDLFHPHRVVAWHEYTRKNRVKVWDDHTTAEKKRGLIELDWVERNNLCHRRNRILFGMDGEDPKQIDFGKYGFGTERTLRDYEEYAGISFEHRAIQQCTLDKETPVFDYKKYESEDEWRDTLTRSYDVRINLNKSELDKDVDDYDFWCLSVEDKEGTIYRKDYTESEVRRFMRGKSDHLDHRLVFLSNRIPDSYVIWPHSKTKGWCTRIQKLC